MVDSQESAGAHSSRDIVSAGHGLAFAFGGLNVCVDGPKRYEKPSDMHVVSYRLDIGLLIKYVLLADVGTRMIVKKLLDKSSSPIFS